MRPRTPLVRVSGPNDRNFTQAKMQRRMDQIETSVARYLDQLDSADRQEPSEARATKTARLTEKIAKLREEMKRLEALEARRVAAPDGQISLTDPDSRSQIQWGQRVGGDRASSATTSRPRWTPSTT